SSSARAGAVHRDTSASPAARSRAVRRLGVLRMAAVSFTRGPSRSRPPNDNAALRGHRHGGASSLLSNRPGAVNLVEKARPSIAFREMSRAGTRRGGGGIAQVSGLAQAVRPAGAAPAGRPAGLPRPTGFALGAEPAYNGVGRTCLDRFSSRAPAVRFQRGHTP